MPQPLLAPVARVLNDELIVSSGGAPSIIPSFKTYKTDITPLLLSSANSQGEDEPTDNPDDSDSSSDQPDNSDTGSADANQ